MPLSTGVGLWMNTGLIDVWWRVRSLEQEEARQWLKLLKVLPGDENVKKVVVP